MSLHSYSRSWLHLIWGTRDREKLLNRQAAARSSEFLTTYAQSKQIYMKINFINADHVHALIDLPTNVSIEGVVQLFKGSSSHWINANDVIKSKLSWGRGYAAFSVSQSNVAVVANYIAGQQEHHRVQTFADELRAFARRHGLKWHED
jgi:putative transposase